MKVVDVACPFCGAKVGMKKAGEFVTCDYCGKQIFVDDEIKKIEHHFAADDAEKLGYQFEKGRLRAQQDAELEALRLDAEINEKSEVENRKQNIGCIKILLWIFFFPFMFLYWLATTNRLSKKAKIIIFVIIILVGAFGEKNKHQSSTQTSSSGVRTETAESVGNPIHNKIEYDPLQKLFLKIDPTMSPEDLQGLLDGEEFKEVFWGKKKYNGYDCYTFAYSQGVANNVRGEDGDYLAIDFDSRRNNKFMNAVYSKKGKYANAILFRYGYYFELGASNPDDQKKWGYYFYSEKLRGDGKSSTPPYVKCNDAKEALNRAINGE